jgi:DNA-binding MarR family transcriptional regulator
MSTVQDARQVNVPPREDWPDLPPPTEAGEVLTDIILTTFRLNGRLMDAAQEMAGKGGITAAWWQVLGGVLDHPRSVAEIGRLMGMTRQGVQRVADLLVERDLAEYRPNPAHQRAKLLACTEAGYWAIRRISLVQRPFADRIGAEVGADQLRAALTTMRHLVALLEADQLTESHQLPGRVQSGARHVLPGLAQARLPS